MKAFARQPKPRWLSWWDGKFTNLAADTAVVAACYALAITVPDGLWQRIAILATLPVLLLRRRFPWLIVLATPLICCGRGSVLPVMVVCYTVAQAWGPRWRTLASVLFADACLTISAWDPKPNDGVLYQLVIPSVWLVIPVLVGLWMHQRRMLLDALHERARQAERQSELLSERAVAAERRRIAREMHDVVAHRVSTIALQAGALTMNAPDERTAETAEVIRSTSATALTELREILNVLRKDQQEPADDIHGVQPDGSVSDDVTALVRDAVAAGNNIHLHAHAELPPVPGTIRRAAYRVVQESLTNAAKHAPNARVDVRLGAERDELRLTVTNRRSARKTAMPAIPGSGYGLLGMRERVMLAEGTFRAESTDDGGYRVHATFPLSRDRSKEPA